MKKKLCILILAISMLTLPGCGKASPEQVDAQDTAQSTGSVEDAAKQLSELSASQMANNIQGMSGTGYYNMAATEEDLQAFYREKGGQIALLTGVSNVMDGSYQQAIYEGIRTYAFSAENTYSYYTPKSTEESDYEACMDEAIAEGAKLVVCGGWEYDIIIGRYQYKYPDIDFLIVDGEPEDDNEQPIEVNSNVHCVYCDCTTAGYLAGYLSVVEGYRRFGFMGGEVMDSVLFYGNGFMDGMQDAAKEIGCLDELELNYTFTGTWLPNDDIYSLACEWYDGGTEVIFSCGGGIYESILKAAEEKKGRMIGVDVNQNAISDVFVTSAINGVSVGVINALDDYFAYGGWPDELAGQKKKYTSADKCASLPFDRDSWRFENVTIEDYFKLYTRISGGELKVENKYERSQVEFKVNEITTNFGE